MNNVDPPPLWPLFRSWSRLRLALGVTARKERSPTMSTMPNAALERSLWRLGFLARTLSCASIVLGPGLSRAADSPEDGASAAETRDFLDSGADGRDDGPLDFRGDAVPMDAQYLPKTRGRRKLGTNTTIFVNFDGVTLGHCNPSNSKENCSWINPGIEFPPWSGSWQTRVAILDSMRSKARDLGIRITGVRPPDHEDYVMIVYGSADDADEDEVVLGRAPSGDCWDQLPNQIGFAYLDGEYASWTNGGATTVLHEAGHTWGLDHIDANYAVMSPAGDNSNAYFNENCHQVVSGVELEPGGESCPEINLEQCGVEDAQRDKAVLKMLFGEPYVDEQAPVLELVSPADGAYFQGPANFDVDLEIHDDLHPQLYSRAISVDGLVEYPFEEGLTNIDFPVAELPNGNWTFEIRVRDEAGNESSLEFRVDVGDEAPHSGDDGCACASTNANPARLLWALILFPLAHRRRKR